jgi:hypothetical protein
MDKTIKGLQHLIGKEVEIVTIHEWFGKEKYNCKFDLILDDRRIGFKVQNSEIYVLRSDLEALEAVNGVCRIKDFLMEIIIKSQ